MATFYAGQTDYIDILNTLATANDLSDIDTGLANLDASVAAASASASTASTQAGIATTQANNAANSATEASGYLAPVTATSTTSTLMATGSVSQTIQTGKSFVAGHPLKIARTSAPSTNFMTGTVTSYNSGTGALVANITSITGSGTYTDWTLSLSSYAGSGTVTTASVVSANGFGGSVATATTTPAITLTTSVTGIVKGNGTSISAATVRTDYAEPTTALATGLLKNTTTTGEHTIATVRTDYAEPTTALATGLLKNTTATGEHTIAAAGTDYVAPGGDLGTPSSGVATNLTGTASGLTAGTVTTNANLTGEATSTGNAVTLTNSAVIGKVLTGYASGSGTVAATDTILQAINKLNGNDGLKANIAAPTFTGTATFASYVETIHALSGTAIVPDNGTIQTKTLSGNTTFTESIADGQSVVLMFNPSTYTITWPTISWVRADGLGTAPTLKASVVNVIVLWRVGATRYGNWLGSM